MSINKRSTPRQPLQLDVEIFSCGTYLGRSATRDIHADGAYIEFGTDELFQNDVLELRLIPDLDEIKPVRLRAMVVRSCDNGIGVLFGYGEHDFNRLLKKLFKYPLNDYSGETVQSMISGQ